MKVKSETILRAFRGLAPCEYCQRYRDLSPHHYWFHRGAGGATRLDHPFNLISLCRDCHERAHRAPSAEGFISRQACLLIVARREGVRALSLVEYLTWLCRQDKHRPVRA